MIRIAYQKSMTQNAHSHPTFSHKNPPIKGPIIVPRKGLALYTDIGAARCSVENISLTVPPATVRKAEPARAAKNLGIINVAVFFANGVGICKITKSMYDTRKMILRP